MSHAGGSRIRNPASLSVITVLCRWSVTAWNFVGMCRMRRRPKSQYHIKLHGYSNGLASTSPWLLLKEQATSHINIASDIRPLLSTSIHKGSSVPKFTLYPWRMAEEWQKITATAFKKLHKPSDPVVVVIVWDAASAHAAAAVPGASCSTVRVTSYCWFPGWLSWRYHAEASALWRQKTECQIVETIL